MYSATNALNNYNKRHFVGKDLQSFHLKMVCGLHEKLKDYCFPKPLKS